MLVSTTRCAFANLVENARSQPAPGVGQKRIDRPLARGRQQPIDTFHGRKVGHNCFH